jgi:hypothetical protein
MDPKYIVLTESLLPAEANLIRESSSDNKTMWLNGICMQSTVKNRNGRIYSKKDIAEAVATAMAIIKEDNGIFGELDHPQTLNINSDRVSHAITEMWMVGNDAYGKAKLLNTPCGLIGQELLKSGVRMGVSSRGAGQVNESGEVTGFFFKTYDLVITPSAQSAYPKMMYESLDSKQGSRVLSLAESLQRDDAAQKYFKKEIMKFINETLFK